MKHPSSPTPARVIARLLANVEQAGDCVVSRYSTGSHGYAQIGWTQDGRTQMRLAHRVAWEAAHGPIPDGMTVHHECHVRTCVNTGHMRLESNLENARRTSGREWAGEGACEHGHDDSLRIPFVRQGVAGTTCGPCLRDSQARYRQRRRGGRKEAA